MRSGRGIALSARVPGLIQAVGRNVAQDLLGLIGRARASVPESRRSHGFLPPGFTTLAFAGLLVIAAAGAHQWLWKRGPPPSRPRTRQRTRMVSHVKKNRAHHPGWTDRAGSP